MAHIKTTHKSPGSTNLGLRRRVQRIANNSQLFDVLLTRYKNILDIAGIGIIIYDLQGNIVWVDETMSRLTGYTADELSKMTVSQIVSDKARNELWERTRSQIAGDSGTQHYELELVRKDGAKSAGDIVTIPLNNEGQIVGIQAMVKDVTERRHTEEELRWSNEFNFNLIEQSPYPVLVKDVDGTIIRVNPAFERLTGYSSSELIGAKAPYPWWTDQTLEQQAIRREAALSRSGKKFEEKFRKKNGEIFWVEVFPAAIVIEGKFEHQLNIWVDITDRKKRQKDMEYYVSEVIKAHEDERYYIASELHDGVVQNLSALALDIGGLVAAEKKTNRNTMESLTKFKNRISEIISDVRRFCHKLRPDILDRIGLISALHMLADEMSSNGKLKANVQVMGVLERLSPDTELALFRVAQEALNNVVKHSGATIASVTVDFNPSELKLTMSDNGRGFDSTGFIDSLPGTGKLGLLGMRDRARLVKGSFSLDSQVGKGTSVSIVIPRQKSSSTG